MFVTALYVLVGEMETAIDHDEMLAKIRDATPSSDGRYYCLYDYNTCDKSYEHRFNLIAHYKVEHLGLRFFCPKCQKPFKKKDTMLSHEKKCTGITVTFPILLNW